MRRPAASFIALACALAVGSPSLARPSIAIPGTVAVAAQAPSWQVGAGLQADPNVRFGVLPNGMRFAIRKNATPPGEASLRLLIGAGSLNEAENQRGLAHFLEHMVLNGTRNVPEGEFIKRLERHGLKFGPDTNASTGFDNTVYMLDLPETDADTVDTALFLLREVADKATLDPKAIDRERGIILAEERTRATPQLRQIIDEFGFLYPGQLLPNRLPIGSTEVIKTAPRERFVEFYEAYYRPENATLVAIGDFDVAQMETKIRQMFRDWKGQGKAGAPADQGQPRQRSAEANTFTDPAASTQASIAWIRPADLTPDSRARRVRDTVESLGLSVLNRRLERIASTQKPAPFIFAQSVESQLADTADFTQVFAVAQPGGWQKALEAIDQEQRRLVQHGITQPELDREIAQQRTALLQAVAGANTRPSPQLAQGIVNAAVEDRTVLSPEARLALFDEATKGLTAAQVNAAVKRLFTGSGPLINVSSPTPVQGDKQAVLAAYQASTKLAVAPPATQQAIAWPYTSFGTPGRVTERREIPEVGATAVTFANGVRLTVKPTNFAKNEIRVAVRVGDGRLDLYSPQAPLVGLLSQGAFTLGGLKKISAEDMSQALTGKTYGAGFGVDDDAFVMAGQTRGEDFATQMQVLAAYLAEPGWQPTGYDRFKGIYPSILSQLESTPGGVFARESDVLLRSGDVRWKTPTAEQVAASTIQDARSLVEAPLSRDPIEVVIVGDTTVDEAVRQTAATFGALPARSAQPARPGPLTFPKPPKDPVVLTHKGRADQGLAFLAWPTRDFYSNTVKARHLNALAAVFQLRLTEKIREEEGVSYSPFSAHSASDVFPGYGYFFGTVEAPPEALAQFLKDAQAIADDLRTKPVSADELQRALKPVVEKIQRDRTTNAWWLNQLGNIQTDPRVLAATQTQLRDYQNVTPGDLQQVAREYLKPDAAYRITVVPQAKQ